MRQDLDVASFVVDVRSSLSTNYAAGASRNPAGDPLSLTPFPGSVGVFTFYQYPFRAPLIRWTGRQQRKEKKKLKVTSLFVPLTFPDLASSTSSNPPTRHGQSLPDPTRHSTWANVFLLRTDEAGRPRLLKLDHRLVRMTPIDKLLFGSVSPAHFHPLLSYFDMTAVRPKMTYVSLIREALLGLEDDGASLQDVSLRTCLLSRSRLPSCSPFALGHRLCM